MKREILVAIIFSTLLALTTKAQTVRDCFLVDSVYNLVTGEIKNYFYNEDNKLIEKITLGRFNGRDNTQEICKFEYEEGHLRRVRIYLLFENDTTHYISGYYEFFYNQQQQLTKYEFRYHELAPAVVREEMFYIDGTNYIDSIYSSDDNPPQNLYDRCSIKFIYDDEMKNVIRKIFHYPYPPELPTGYHIENMYYEYDNHPTPNCGIDELVAYPIFAPIGGILGSNNNMIENTRCLPDMYDTTIIRCYTYNYWSFTYNEYGLLETETFYNRPTPSSLIKYKQICDIITTPNIEFTEQILIYPNPTIGQLRITNFELGKNIEIYDITGRMVYQTNKPTNQQTTTIDISHLQAGIYILKVGNEIAKIIKN
jgi:hypothetical protein